MLAMMMIKKVKRKKKKKKSSMKTAISTSGARTRPRWRGARGSSCARPVVAGGGLSAGRARSCNRRGTRGRGGGRGVWR